MNTIRHNWISERLASCRAEAERIAKSVRSSGGFQKKSAKKSIERIEEIARHGRLVWRIQEKMMDAYDRWRQSR